jgi:hypothetical protein
MSHSLRPFEQRVRQHLPVGYHVMGRNFASDVVTVLGRFKLCPTLASPPLPRLLDRARPFGAFRLRQGSFPIERTRLCRQL